MFEVLEASGELLDAAQRCMYSTGRYWEAYPLVETAGWLLTGEHSLLPKLSSPHHRLLHLRENGVQL